MINKNPRPSSPTSTTPLLSETASTSATHGSSSAGSVGSPSSPRYNTVPRVPTFMQTSVPSRRSIIHAFLDMTMHMMFELVLPIVLYYALRTQFSPIISLVVAGIPPALVVVVKGVRDHKVDMMGLLMLLGFVASVLLALVESDPKLYLLRESAMTSAMGIMLVVTLFPLRWRHRILRPFMFYVARQIAVSGTVMLPPETVRLHWDWFWTNWLSFRAFFRGLTAIWGIGLLSEFLVRVVLIYTVDEVDDIMYYSNIYMFSVTLCLGTLTVASTLLYRHLYNQEQKRSKSTQRRMEIEEIIARADEENRLQKQLREQQ
ncbi:hypothetical protein BDA99DRAFT_499227 [Phascolomyces articulosus]|uniref:Transmembrane protein n=1 Tax=Phascolomyces articulosus TaxID=60185 RepID=A0AAD5K7A5_9FUNG|nr:hypothetical protein BDA99DRAFT_499227 [Phascolomyces articulosus]